MPESRALFQLHACAVLEALRNVGTVLFAELAAVLADEAPRDLQLIQTYLRAMAVRVPKRQP